MGSSRVSAAVADAGPIIHLAEIGCLSPVTVFNMVYIPDSVWLEIVGQRRVQEADISGLSNVSRYTLARAQVTQFIKGII